jgi:hypothetical protein
VLEELGRHAAKGDRVFSLNNCSSAYAPEPWLFHCAYKGDLEFWPERTVDEIQKTDCRFVILAFDAVGQKTLEILRRQVRVEDVWQDSRFTLHRIGGSGTASTITADAK